MEQTPTPNQQQNDSAPKPPEQPYYVPVVPEERPPKHPGRTEGILAIIFAVIALGFLPPVFGLAGIILAVRAQHKGSKTLGIVALVLSIVFMIAGFALGAYVSSHNH